MLSDYQLLAWRIMVILDERKYLKVHNSHPWIRFHNFYGCLISEVYRNWLFKSVQQIIPNKQKETEFMPTVKFTDRTADV